LTTDIHAIRLEVACVDERVMNYERVWIGCEVVVVGVVWVLVLAVVASTWKFVAA